MAAALVAAEAASRQYWARQGLSFFRAQNEFSRLHYPELAGALDRPPKPGIGSYNVLVLGETTLDPSRSAVARELEIGLERSTGRQVSVTNLARAGNTTRDSWFKARRLAETPFDLVVLQHGLEDLLANNAPRGLFRADYAHYGEYRRINDFEARRRDLLLPFTLGRVVSGAGRALAMPYSSPRGRPSRLEAAHGGEIKTEEPLRENLKRVLDFSADADRPVVLLTTAHYIPADYSEGRLLEGQLDFGGGPVAAEPESPVAAREPIENWGAPAAVAEGIARHNAAIADLASFYPNVIFVDADGAIPKSRRTYRDFCHLTGEGSRILTDAILRAADRALDLESLIPPSIAGGG